MEELTVGQKYEVVKDFDGDHLCLRKGEVYECLWSEGHENLMRPVGRWGELTLNIYSDLLKAV
jgi:hypothetical protein